MLILVLNHYITHLVDFISKQSATQGNPTDIEELLFTLQYPPWAQDSELHSLDLRIADYMGVVSAEQTIFMGGHKLSKRSVSY